jgi:hypothetical protein
MYSKTDLKRFLPRYLNHHTPASDYLFDLMRPLMETSLRQEYRYSDCFDLFEYLLALVDADFREKSKQETNANGYWGPIGRPKSAGSKPGYTLAAVKLALQVPRARSAPWTPASASAISRSIRRLSSKPLSNSWPATATSKKAWASWP